MNAAKLSQRVNAQIEALRAVRDAPGASAAESAAAQEAIARLRGVLAAGEVAEIDIFVGRVNQALDELEEVRTRHNLDAVSSLGLTIRRLREAVENAD